MSERVGAVESCDRTSCWFDPLPRAPEFRSLCRSSSPHRRSARRVGMHPGARIPANPRMWAVAAARAKARIGLWLAPWRWGWIWRPTLAATWRREPTGFLLGCCWVPSCLLACNRCRFGRVARDASVTDRDRPDHRPRRRQHSPQKPTQCLHGRREDAKKDNGLGAEAPKPLISLVGRVGLEPTTKGL